MSSSWYHGPNAKKRAIRAALTQLVLKDRIVTTFPLARKIKPFADRLMTLTKRDQVEEVKALVSMHAMTIPKLRGAMRERYGNRSGGFTRVVKTGWGWGNKAPRAMVEFVDAPGDWREWYAREVLVATGQDPDEVVKEALERREMREKGESFRRGKELTGTREEPGQLPNTSVPPDVWINPAILRDKPEGRNASIDPLKPLLFPRTMTATVPISPSTSATTTTTTSSSPPSSALKTLSLHQILTRHGPLAFYNPRQSGPVPKDRQTIQQEKACAFATKHLVKTHALKNHEYQEEKWPPFGEKIIARHRLVWHLLRDFDELNRRGFKIGQLERRQRRNEAMAQGKKLDPEEDQVRPVWLRCGKSVDAFVEVFRRYYEDGDKDLERILELEASAVAYLKRPEVARGYKEEDLDDEALEMLSKVEERTEDYFSSDNYGKSRNNSGKKSIFKSAVPKVESDSNIAGPQRHPPHPTCVSELLLIPPYLRSPFLNDLLPHLDPTWVIPPILKPKRIWLREYGLVPSDPPPSSFRTTSERASDEEGARNHKFNRMLGITTYRDKLYTHPAVYVREEGIAEENY